MNKVIFTNLPIHIVEFNLMQNCFLALELPFQLAHDENMEEYINSNNCFFQCKDDRMRELTNIVKACNALHRTIINLRLLND